MLPKTGKRKQRSKLKLSRALNNSVVFVTGSSSGIGAATAREIARHLETVAFR